MYIQTFQLVYTKQSFMNEWEKTNEQNESITFNTYEVPELSYAQQTHPLQ